MTSPVRDAQNPPAELQTITRSGAALLPSSSDPTDEIRRLAALLDVSQALSGTLNLRAALQRVLEILELSHGVLRAALTLLDSEVGQLYIEASSGIGADGQRARYRLGEGITGRVVASGRPIIVPQVSREPLFLHRTADRSRQEVSFICVPLVINHEPAGALAVDLRFEAGRDYEQAAKFFGVVASQIAQAIKIQRLVEVERQRLTAENAHLREELRERYDFANIVGNSGPMRRVFEQVEQVAGTNTTVLIRGESGTGKELIAHAIHYHSPRSKKPFVKVSCAALPATLIESELFGYERGAFTGAHARKKGRFELAEGGTLFLDEIGELEPATQVKLLRVLQQREFERVGGTETLRANVRVIGATNKDLERAIAASRVGKARAGLRGELLGHRQKTLGQPQISELRIAQLVAHPHRDGRSRRRCRVKDVMDRQRRRRVPGAVWNEE